METIELFFIGSGFYLSSGTTMSSIYEVKTKRRYDWGFVQRELSQGNTVIVRPATEDELQWAKVKLADIQLAERSDPH